MGLTVCRVAFPHAPDGSERIWELWPTWPFTVIQPLGGRWSVFAIEPAVPDAQPLDVMEAMSEITARSSLPSVVVHVLDSDCALVAGIAVGADPAVVIFNEKAADDYGEYADVLERYVPDTAALDRWSVQAKLPRLEQTHIDALVADEFTFADEPIAEIADTLRLPLLGEPSYPELEGLLIIHDSKTPIDGKYYKTTRTRYAHGRGAGFWGVWDRKNPGPPLQKFPHNHEGMLEARAMFIQLLADLPEHERHY